VRRVQAAPGGVVGQEQRAFDAAAAHGGGKELDEYVYSYGDLAEGSLAKAFTEYLAHYLLRVQGEAEKSQPAKQPDYFACGADRVRELCARNDR
jgi:hypothetical protein